MPSSKMSFYDYINNPSGGTSVYTNRDMYKKLYKDKFDAVLLREQGTINYTVYRTNDNRDTYYIHIKIPLEVSDTMYYDVVVKLYTTDNKQKNNTSLKEYIVQFYANDPAFVYTFAYAFHKNHLFIEELSDRMSKKALTTPAKIKNPKNEIWYVKSLYFAYLTMVKYNLFSRTAINARAEKYNRSLLASRITPADIAIANRQAIGYQPKRKPKPEPEEKEDKTKSNNNAHATKHAPTTKYSKTTGYTKKTKTTKKS